MEKNSQNMRKLGIILLIVGMAGFMFLGFVPWNQLENDALKILVLAILISFSGGFIWYAAGRIIEAIEKHHPL